VVSGFNEKMPHKRTTSVHTGLACGQICEKYRLIEYAFVFLVSPPFLGAGESNIGA